MSEIVFPSEIVIPAAIDWENPNVIALNTASKGIFFTSDNLTTVTNVIDNSAGTSTDIINNELGAVVDGFRVGIDTTGLASEVQTSLTTNPYQVFKTQEDVQQEYGLVFDSASHRLNFPATIDNVDGEIVIGMSTDDAANSIVINLNSATAARITINTTGSIAFHNDTGSHWGFSGGHTATVANEHFYIKIARASGTISISKSLDGVNWVLLRARSGLDFLMGDFDQIASTNNLTLRSLLLKGPIVSNATRYWEFNQTNGETVVDHYNNTVATLVGFPVDNSQWQEIVAENLYTIGVSKDYPTLYAMASAMVADNNQHTGVIYGQVAVGGLMDNGGISGDFSHPQGLNFIANSAEYYSGDDTATLATIDVTANPLVVRATNSIMKGFKVATDALNSVGIIGTTNNAHNHQLSDLLIELGGGTGGYGAAIIYQHANDDVQIKRVKCVNTARSAIRHTVGNTRIKVSDSIIVDCNKSLSASYAGYHNVTAINCISANNGHADFKDSVTTHCISSDATATQNDFTGAFVDEANNDYRINQAFADANLVGQGWNNSDIAAWALFIAVAGDNYSGSASFNISTSLVSSGAKVSRSNPSINNSISELSKGNKSSNSNDTLINSASFNSSGNKASSGKSTLAVLNTFSISGTAAEIISKVGSATLLIPSSFNCSGIKSAQGKVSTIPASRVIVAGYKYGLATFKINTTTDETLTGHKSLNGSVDVNIHGNLVSIGNKQNFGNSSLLQVTLVMALGIGGSFVPISRSITIAGQLNKIMIVGQVSSSITIQGVLN